MLEELRSAPGGERRAGPRTTIFAWTLAALLLLAVTQLLMFEEAGWNVGVLLAAVVLLGNLAWRLSRRT
jgi:hypothetical protein